MNQEKRKYFEPRVKMIRLETEDIITTSENYNNVSEESGIDLPVDPFTPWKN